MGLFKYMRKAGLLAVLVSLFSNTGVKAADISFDGSSSGLSFHEAVLSIRQQAQSLNGYKFQTYPAAADVSGVRTYEFNALYKNLRYPDPSYFGSTPEEVQDLETYTSKDDTFYKEVNDYLRYYPKPYDWSGTSPEMAKAMVANIDRIFTRVPPLPGDLVLFRGIGLGFRDNKSYEIGEEFIEKGYASTSTSFKVAHYFAVEKDDGGTSRKAILAIYHNRAGEKGILIDEQEDEVILKHGTKFKIMAKKDTGEKYDLYLVQACSAPCEASLREDVRGFWESFKTR